MLFYLPDLSEHSYFYDVLFLRHAFHAAVLSLLAGTDNLPAKKYYLVFFIKNYLRFLSCYKCLSIRKNDTLVVWVVLDQFNRRFLIRIVSLVKMMIDEFRIPIIVLQTFLSRCIFLSERIYKGAFSSGYLCCSSSRRQASC